MPSVSSVQVYGVKSYPSVKLYGSPTMYNAERTKSVSGRARTDVRAPRALKDGSPYGHGHHE